MSDWAGSRRLPVYLREGLRAGGRLTASQQPHIPAVSVTIGAVAAASLGRRAQWREAGVRRTQLGTDTPLPALGRGTYRLGGGTHPSAATWSAQSRPAALSLGPGACAAGVGGSTRHPTPPENRVYRPRPNCYRRTAPSQMRSERDTFHPGAPCRYKARLWRPRRHRDSLRVVPQACDGSLTVSRTVTSPCLSGGDRQDRQTVVGLPAR